MESKELEKILVLLERYGVEKFEMECEGERIKLSRYSVPTDQNAELSQAVVGVTPALKPVKITEGSNEPTEPTETAKGDEEGWIAITSPIVGTFYRKPSPDAEPFVNVGDYVKKGDTVCIIEAMKLMNEIEATTSGRIEKILLSDGQVVEYGEIIMYINPNA